MAFAERESARESTWKSGDVPRLRFRATDVTAPGAGSALAEELGSGPHGGANVVVRGVLHVLDDPARRAAAQALAQVIGDRGTLLLLETNWSGDLLGYLEHLGARAGRLPAALRRVIDYRLTRPAACGPAELAHTFPADRWVTVASGPPTSSRSCPPAPAPPPPSPASTRSCGRRPRRPRPVPVLRRPNRAFGSPRCSAEVPTRDTMRAGGIRLRRCLGAQ